MRIKYLLIIIVMLSFFNGFAQVSVGAFGGLNVSKLRGDQPVGSEFRSPVGVDLGVLVDYKFSEQFTLSLQPSFSKKGAKISYIVKGEDELVDSVSINFNYLAIPLLLKIAAKNNRYYAIGGLEAGFPMSATANYINESNNEVDIIDYLADVVVVMHFGIGYRIPIGKPTLYVEGRYSQGINNIIPFENPEYNAFPRVRTSAFQLLFGIELPLF
ncbi:MAG: PorT family protein [Draconibacterium sp.]|nr:PorT family protein [Draconibacterium sp.]